MNKERFIKPVKRLFLALALLTSASLASIDALAKQSMTLIHEGNSSPSVTYKNNKCIIDGYIYAKNAQYKFADNGSFSANGTQISISGTVTNYRCDGNKLTQLSSGNFSSSSAVSGDSEGSYYIGSTKMGDVYASLIPVFDSHGAVETYENSILFSAGYIQ